jgi:hypothetical protein
MSNYYLVGSSTLFIVPAAYGFYRGHRVLPAVSLFASIVSVRYWLDPSSVSNKEMDLIVSKLTGIIYFTYGYRYVQSSSRRLIGYANISCILASYQLSCILYPNPLWIPCHMLFHWIGTIGQMIVVY